MRCPKCKVKMNKVYREGWPSYYQCLSTKPDFSICTWTDPVCKTANFINLQKQEDLKAIRIAREDENRRFDELEAHIKSVNYLRQ